MEKAFYNHVKPATTNAISQFTTPMISLKPENLSPHHKRLIHTSLHKKKKYTVISKAHCPLAYITWLRLLARTPLANDDKLSQTTLDSSFHQVVPYNLH